MRRLANLLVLTLATSTVLAANCDPLPPIIGDPGKETYIRLADDLQLRNPIVFVSSEDNRAASLLLL